MPTQIDSVGAASAAIAHHVSPEKKWVRTKLSLFKMLTWAPPFINRKSLRDIRVRQICLIINS